MRRFGLTFKIIYPFLPKYKSHRFIHTLKLGFGKNKSLKSGFLFYIILYNLQEYARVRRLKIWVSTILRELRIEVESEMPRRD